MGSVAIVVASMLLLIAFLDSPFQKGVGGVRPVAMERTLRIVDQALRAVGGAVQLPCDAHGNPASRERRAHAGLGRDRRHGPARVRGGRDDVEQLPGHALERRAGEDVGPREQGPDRRRSRCRASRTPSSRSTWRRSCNGWTRTPGERPSSRASTGHASARSSPRRSTRGWRRGRSRPRALRRRPSRCREYRLAARAEAERLDQTADALAAQVRRDIQRSSNYVLGVVLFAVALFFAGMSTKLTAGGLRKAVLAVGCILFVGTVVWIATFPVSVAV